MTPPKPAPPADPIDCFQRRIGYRFNDPKLLNFALTHSSGAMTRLHSNERLEFLGDSILGMIVTELLYCNYPDYEEGAMTTIKSLVVSRQYCLIYGDHIGLGDVVICGRGMRASDAILGGIVANAFESLIGAVYLDGGLDATKKFLMPMILPAVKGAIKSAAGSNTKSELQQLSQQMFGSTPKYIVMETQGPEHARSFRISVEIGKERYPSAWGKSKKEAESKAAAEAIAKLTDETLTDDEGIEA